MRRALGAIAVALVLAWYLLLSLNTVDLLGDLGRHITNGELILRGLAGRDLAAVGRVLSTNLYSYTCADFPFLNHHWASGVVFALVARAGGIAAFQALFALVMCGAILVFLAMPLNRGRIPQACAVLAPLVPVVADRYEIRPEIFGYLLLGMTYLLVDLWERDLVPRRAVLLLPVVMLAWVNLHISFVFGFLYLGASCLELLVRERPGAAGGGAAHSGRKLPGLLAATGASALLSLANPHGVKTLLYPATMFRNYGYTVLENMSLGELGRMHVSRPSFAVFQGALAAAGVAAALLALRVPRRFPLRHALMCAVTGTMGWLGVRYQILFALSAWVLLCAALAELHVRSRRLEAACLAACLVATGWFAAHNSSFVISKARNFMLGTAPGDADAGKFLRDNGVAGPIFNNFNIGSYLIYHLYPRERVFVDNRPEAYPREFFSSVYVPIQESDAAWERAVRAYRFESIVFGVPEMTPWGRRFLAARARDPAWAPVYLAGNEVVFLRRGGRNREIIARHELPGEFVRDALGQ